MLIDVTVPAVGESISSANIACWHKSSGEFVRQGERLVTLDTDKVSNELEATSDGRLEILIANGQEVAIGTAIGRLDTAGTATPPTPPTPIESPDAPKPAVPADERSTRRPMSMLRRKIATQLVNAQQTAAILTTFNEVDMSAIMEMRRQAQERFLSRHGVKLGYMGFFVKAVVLALKQVPALNVRVDGDEIVEHHYYDIGVAISSDKGLVVPVLRACDSQSLAGIEQDLVGYAEKVRAGKIALADLQGGVFTISNGGVYGSLLSTPILNPPQSGILGLHKILERPIAVKGQVAIRPMMNLALSYDHRVVDGKEAVSFLIRIKDCIENPARMLVGA